MTTTKVWLGISHPKCHIHSDTPQTLEYEWRCYLVVGLLALAGIFAFLYLRKSPKRLTGEETH